MYSHAISLFLVGSLCGVPAVFAQDFDFSNLGGGGFGGGECKPHICGKGKSAVQKRPLKLESSGCQGLGGGMQMFNAGGSSDSGALGSCCDARHACTQLCGSSRTTCDTAFERCANATGDSSASLHVMSVKLGGCQTFEAAQAKACRCVDKDQAAAKREQIISDFYLKHNKEKADDVSKIVAKADNGKKFVALMTQLVGKYPKAVKKVKDPQQAWFDDMMSKAKEDGAVGDDDLPATYSTEDADAGGEEDGEVHDLDAAGGDEL